MRANNDSEDAANGKNNRPPDPAAGEGPVPRLVDVSADAAEGVTTYTWSYGDAYTYTYSYSRTRDPFDHRQIVRNRLSPFWQPGGRHEDFLDDPPTHRVAVDSDPETGKLLFRWLDREERDGWLGSSAGTARWTALTFSISAEPTRRASLLAPSGIPAFLRRLLPQSSESL